MMGMDEIEDMGNTKDMNEICSGQKGHAVHMENMDYMLTYVENIWSIWTT